MGDKGTSRAQPAKRRILIVDDQPLLRRGLTALIAVEPDLVVCATTAGRRSGLEAVASSRPDLVIVGLGLGADHGLALVREVRAGDKDLPILVLSMHDAAVWPRRALDVGANGYVSKRETAAVLLTAMRRVLEGGRT